jgi:hypothetical protein
MVGIRRTYSTFQCLTSILLLLITITTFDDYIIHVVKALPTGAPVCTVGEAAPQNLHLDPQRNPRLGPLSDGGYYIQIGNTVLKDTSVIYEFEAYQDLTVLLTSQSGVQPFKGALIVLSKVGVDLAGNLFLNATQLQLLRQSQCDAGRVAVTHNNNITKTAVTATINFDDNYDILNVDVNLVVVNNAKNSVFFYSSYKLTVTGATSSPTPVPIPTCGLFGMGLFCLPKITFCGFLGRLFMQDQRDCRNKV